MIPISWKQVKSWHCINCGKCCRGYQVVLQFNEWVNLIRNYGVTTTKPVLNMLCLERKSDGTCFFLNRFLDTYICGLQHNKPKACKLWPFKIFSKPKFGRPREAFYRYHNRNFFIYVDSECAGLNFGKPIPEFAYKTLPEFIEIALGLREKQLNSTAKINLVPTRAPQILQRIF